MRIGIVTLVSDNYGNKFQNYAVEQLLSTYGTVETFAVESIPSQSQQRKSLLSILSLGHVKTMLRSRMMYLYDLTDTSRSLMSSLWYVWKNKVRLKDIMRQRHQSFEKFNRNFLHLSSRTITRNNCHDESWNNEFSVFVCGSDQIWNPTYSTTSELAFLSFAKIKSIALAPSFGGKNLPSDTEDNIRKWLTNIRHLSCREKSGCDIISRLTGRSATLLTDPTMALPVEQWDKLAQSPKSPLPEHYVLCYFLGSVNKEYKKRINEVSQRLGLPVVTLFDITVPEYYTLGPCEVLYAIKQANYVLTDSFHGSVFSILFRRSFCVYKRNEGGLDMSTRLEDLLRRFNLQHCIYDENALLPEVSSEQWIGAHDKLKIERANFINYLNTAVKDITQNEYNS